MTGCQQQAAKGPTQKEMANREWNAARSSVLAQLANEQYRAGNLDKSRQSVAEALKFTPDNAALHVLSAKLAIEGAQLELAEQQLKLARELAPKDGEAFYLSGVVYQRWQKPETAYEFYQQAASRAPAELPYLLAESEMLVAMDRTPEALALLQSKVTYFEHSAAIRDAAGQLLMQAGRYPEALAMLRDASILSENDTGIHERLALALYANAAYQDCAESLNTLLTDQTYTHRADLFLLLGDCQLHLHNPRAARATLETVTQLDIYSSRGWQLLAQSAMECGDVRRAELSLDRSIALDQKNGESQLLLGYVRLGQNRFGDALAAFQNASKADLRDTVSLCMQGYALEKLGRAEEASKCYKLALQIKPDDEMASQLMASIDLNDQ
jgi:Flp pilus assembly protein TadD